MPRAAPPGAEAMATMVSSTWCMMFELDLVSDDRSRWRVECSRIAGGQATVITGLVSWALFVEHVVIVA